VVLLVRADSQLVCEGRVGKKQKQRAAKQREREREREREKKRVSEGDLERERAGKSSLRCLAGLRVRLIMAIEAPKRQHERRAPGTWDKSLERELLCAIWYLQKRSVMHSRLIIACTFAFRTFSFGCAELLPGDS
jgi:hypothetical protein